MQENPPVAYPICEQNVVAERDGLGPGFDRYLTTPMLRRLGRHYCDVVFSSGLATDSNGFTPAEQDSLGKQHPELLTPFCLAGGQVEFDKEQQHVLSRPDMRKVMRRVCPEAVRRGYATLSGKTDYAAARELSKRITLQMIRSGQIHPLASD